jgi:hypothetical protein
VSQWLTGNKVIVMNITCKACGKVHKSNSKIEKSIMKLAPGQKVRLKCSQCGEQISLGKEILSDDVGVGKVRPPEPPDTSWLADGDFEEEAVVSDIPQAMVLVKDEKIEEQVVSALTGLGYRAETVDDVAEAIDKMQFFNYSSIVMQSSFGGTGLEENKFHELMSSMSMARRRYIFYALLGPEFNTFYNLQALACSANLVVNEKDTSHFGVILRKSIPEYEELFGPFMEELKVQGR